MKQLLYLLVFIFLKLIAVCQTVQPGLKITPIAPDFYVYSTFKMYGGNPLTTNGMYVVTNSGVILMDAPWDTTQFQPLLDSIMNKHHKKVVLSVATHFHEDRTGGLNFLNSKGVATYATAMTDSLSKLRNEQRSKYLIYKDTVFSIGQHSFNIYYPGAGHSPDNIVVWFDKEKVLYGGCLIKSADATDLGNLGDANVHQWPQTLRNVQAHCKNPRWIITGHDNWRSTQSLKHTLQLLKDYNK